MIPYSTLDRPSVLIVALAGIGNLLMQTPMITALKRANLRAEISVLVAPRGTTEVLERNPNVAAIFRGSPKPSVRQWPGMVKTIQRGRFDIGIVTYPGQLIMSSSLLFFGRVRMRIGHRYSFRVLRDMGLFLTHAIPEQQPLHDVEQNLRLLAPLGIPSDAAGTHYAFPLAREDRAAADAFLETRTLRGKELIGFHPGAHRDMPWKRWPAERWVVLGNRLTEQYGATILLFGGPDERELKATVWRAMVKKPVDVELPLRASAALMRHCRLFVSNDSGLMHVAVSQDVPTFGLFGPTDERRTAPWVPHGHVIRAPGTHPTYDVSHRRSAMRHTTDPSLFALTVDAVLSTVVRTIAT